MLHDNVAHCTWNVNHKFICSCKASWSLSPLAVSHLFCSSVQLPILHPAPNVFMHTLVNRLLAGRGKWWLNAYDRIQIQWLRATIEWESDCRFTASCHSMKMPCVLRLCLLRLSMPLFAIRFVLDCCLWRPLVFVCTVFRNKCCVLLLLLFGFSFSYCIILFFFRFVFVCVTLLHFRDCVVYVLFHRIAADVSCPRIYVAFGRLRHYVCAQTATAHDTINWQLFIQSTEFSQRNSNGITIGQAIAFFPSDMHIKNTN